MLRHTVPVDPKFMLKLWYILHLAGSALFVAICSRCLELEGRNKASSISYTQRASKTGLKLWGSGVHTVHGKQQAVFRGLCPKIPLTDFKHPP